MSTSAIDGRDWAVIVGISGVSHDYKKKEEDTKMTDRNESCRTNTRRRVQKVHKKRGFSPTF